MAIQQSRSDSPNVLEHACEVLGLVEGYLLPTSATPNEKNEAEWTDKGDWLKLANSLGAQSVFFVENEPVLVLARLPDGADEAAFFNRIWCMARPQMLFLAKEGELAVLKLSAPPVGGDEPVRSESRLLALAESTAEIMEKLSDFTRESIESGKLFGEERFGSGYFRADRALVHDLKIVRRQLTSGDEPLSDEVAHSLIGRALFVRYLEDRKILIEDYFESVARGTESWEKQLEKPPAVFADSRHAELRFFRVLENREFTYAFFKQLAADFNGDTFPVTRNEEREVKAHHLKTLRKLLTGDADESGQEHLFLFAYHFDVIPIELISSIYEEFYTAKRGRGNTQSSFYTPPALADFLLARVLTPQVLEQRPRITDPACGSGIFLVEAFRRIVRYRMARQGRRLSQKELRVILRDQIRGMDLNSEAVPVAAFSLYLAYLHYQEPREINEVRRLPNLRHIADRENRDPDQHLDILFQGNAFDAIASDDPILQRHFGPASADVVVGNPPWGEVKSSDDLGRAALPATKKWLETNQHIIGDNEMSQAFVHLALELMADGGKAALLLSSGVLFKQHENSRAFRQSWLHRSKLEHLVNFAHVRHIFFSDPARPKKGKRKGTLREADGSFPFISAIFGKGKPRADHRFSLWSARRTAEIENTRAVVISQTDMHRLRQDDCLRYENLWKLYWWGGRRDEGLIRELERFSTLAQVCLNARQSNVPAQGYTPGTSNLAPTWFGDFKECPTAIFTRYGQLSNAAFVDAPSTVHRPGSKASFSGSRLLVKRGVGLSKHLIVSRIDTVNYLVSNSINCFPLNGLTDIEMKCVLGITWSSLAVYYFWLTANSWGMWHDELQKYVACSLPIAALSNKAKTAPISKIVTRLQAVERGVPSDLFEFHPQAKRLEEEPQGLIAKLESELDEAVFDLYELNEADRDLVQDMCRYGLDFFYKRGESMSLAPIELPSRRLGLKRNLPADRTDGLTGYLQVFLSHWNADLEPDAELAWEVIEGPAGSAVLAVLFSTTERGKNLVSARDSSPQSWQDVLTRINNRALVPIGTRRAIFTDTFVRAVSEHEILIVKRNETRHWTRSMAREDVDATINRAMQLADRNA